MKGLGLFMKNSGVSSQRLSRGFCIQYAVIPDIRGGYVPRALAKSEKPRIMPINAYTSFLLRAHVQSRQR